MSAFNRDDRWHFRLSTRVIGSKGAVLVALVVAMIIVLPSSAMAATVLMVGGLGQSTLDDATMRRALNGTFTGTDPESGTPWRRVNVSWPANAAPLWGITNLAYSVDVGTNNLVAAIKNADSTTDAPITVVGTSAGSLVVDEAMRVLANDPTWHPRNAINYVVLADSTQKLAGTTPPAWNPFDTLSGYTYKAPPVTPYDLTVVSYEYDGFAEFPDRWWNLYAVSNAVVGGVLLHYQTWLVGPNLDTMSAVKTVTRNSMNGLTTTYVVQSETLPLVQLFPQLAPMEDWLKEQIDAGYSRNDRTAVSNSLSPRETASLATFAGIASNPQTVPSTIDASAGETANPSPVEERSRLQQRLANSTARRIEGTSSTPAPVDGTQETANATVGEAEEPPQADPQLANAAEAVKNGTTHLTGRRNVKPFKDGGGGTGGTKPVLSGASGRKAVSTRGGTGALSSGPKGAGLAGGAGGTTPGSGSTPGGTEGTGSN